jgi:hypothetical protein
MLHHLRHVVWRSGIEVHRNDRVYIEQGNIKLGESK